MVQIFVDVDTILNTVLRGGVFCFRSRLRKNPFEIADEKVKRLSVCIERCVIDEPLPV